MYIYFKSYLQFGKLKFTNPGKKTYTKTMSKSKRIF